MFQHTKFKLFFRRQAGASNGFNSGMALDPVDGLVCPQSPIQQRLHQIIQDYKVLFFCTNMFFYVLNFQLSLYHTNFSF